VPTIQRNIVVFQLSSRLQALIALRLVSIQPYLGFTDKHEAVPKKEQQYPTFRCPSTYFIVQLYRVAAPARLACRE
jgi:hypothetical protein